MNRFLDWLYPGRGSADLIVRALHRRMIEDTLLIAVALGAIAVTLASLLR